MGGCGKNDDVGVGLAFANDVGHVGGGGRRAEVGGGDVGGVEHEVWGSVEEFVVDEESGAVGEHVTDAGLGGGFEFARFVAGFDCRFDFVLGFAVGTLVFDENAHLERGCGAFGVEAHRLTVEGILAIDDAGKAVGAVADLDVAGVLQNVDGGLAGDFGRGSTFSELDLFVVGEREVVSGLDRWSLCEGGEVSREDEKSDREKFAHGGSSQCKRNFVGLGDFDERLDRRVSMLQQVLRLIKAAETEIRWFAGRQNSRERQWLDCFTGRDAQSAAGRARLCYLSVSPKVHLGSSATRT